VSENQGITPQDITTSPPELPLSTDIPTSEDHFKLRESFDRVASEKVALQAENERLSSKVAELERTVKTNAILDSLIVPLADKIFWFMCSYCAFVGGVVIYAFRIGILTENVIAILVGSTAVTVIGLIGTIVAGIFTGARRSSN
jgi:hypothetical protein